jgi:MvdD-like protein with pre-ATP grasp domain/ribosomal protein S6-L-glutamate ligase RimK-like protein
LKQGPLVLTNTGDETADFVTAKLAERGVPYLRINTDQVVESIKINATENGAVLIVDGYECSVEAVPNVWLRRPEGFAVPPSSDPNADVHTRREWTAAIEGILARIPSERWINHPAANVGASYKVEQLSRARAMGFCVPETIVTQSRDEAMAFFRRHDGAVVVKSLSGGYIERQAPGQDTVVYTRAVSENMLSSFPRDCACPTLFQKRINKQHDVRVVAVDADVYGVTLRQSNEILDIRENNFVDVVHQSVRLPDSVTSLILKYVRSYRLRFAALDMAIDQDGRWVFFEINPNGEWMWLERRGAIAISESLIKAFYSCDAV